MLPSALSWVQVGSTKLHALLADKYSYVVVGGLVIVSREYPSWVADSIPDDPDPGGPYTSDIAKHMHLVAVLQHPINVTYDDYIGSKLSKLNGIDVKDLAHLVELMLALPPEGDLVIDFAEKHEVEGGKLVESDARTHVVFDIAELKANEAAILTADKVPCWCSPELLPKLEAALEGQSAEEPEPEA
eukprot:COSAG01_NODE_6426_length_3674_cov_1.718042_1_plen_187_part_00